MHDASLTLFAHVADRHDEDIELDVAALLIGEWTGDELELDHYLGVLDHFAERAQRNWRAHPDEPFAEIRVLNRTLFGELGFRGNTDDYYDPRNSFLHQVIERRSGIPISLSVLYMEVARRMSLDISGISFPGHFLVRYDRREGSVIIDPFRMGITLDTADLTELLRRAAGPEAELTSELLRPAGKRAILLRMLTNLVHIYRRRGDLGSALEVVERMHILDRDNPRIERELERLRGHAAEMN
ncbi:SirB1 family protein [Haliangium sp.]|uniref:SirB1 family protein n=1 Tax=Haliangium sp. TaxID=2663208 RepID=UPI003D1125EB